MPRQGPLEALVRREIAKGEQYQLSGECESGILENAYDDAVASRESLNAHMGRLQRAIAERKELLARAERREGREHERETDPILRPDGQC